MKKMVTVTYKIYDTYYTREYALNVARLLKHSVARVKVVKTPVKGGKGFAVMIGGKGSVRALRGVIL